MKTFFRRLISQALIACLATLPFTAHAGLIGTDEAMSAHAQTDRATVVNFLARADVQRELQTHGLTAQGAQERVAALTDAEVQQIAGRIDAAPAGGTSGAVAVVGVTLLVALVGYAIVRAIYPQR